MQDGDLSMSASVVRIPVPTDLEALKYARSSAKQTKSAAIELCSTSMAPRQHTRPTTNPMRRHMRALSCAPATKARPYVEAPVARPPSNTSKNKTGLQDSQSEPFEVCAKQV